MNINFPNPPDSIQNIYTNTGVVQAETYTPSNRFSRLISNGAPSTPYESDSSNTDIVVEGKKKKKSSSTEVTTTKKKPLSSKEIVESTQYVNMYNDTNSMCYNIIAQSDALLNDAKQELDYIRSSRSMKGKYLYMNTTLSYMSSLLSTKLQAIREINNNIKTANEFEYKRYKDNRALDTTDDNKAIMDAYKAFISTPVGAPQYHQPTTMDITAGINGVIKANLPGSEEDKKDPGYLNYMSTLTPEKNLMLHDNNPDIEEVIVYDQATGAKYFQWMNTRTNEVIPNMPIDDDILLEDYVIDPRTRLAKNINLNMVKKVVYLNEGKFDNY